MSNIKWIKINTDMFYDEKIRLIDALPERDIIFYVWIRLLIQAGICNQNGDIFLRENTPYTNEMLSALFLRPLDAVESAVQVLIKFGMIEILDNNRIRVVNWSKHQNVEGMDKVREQNRLRMKRKRQRDKKMNQEETFDDLSDTQGNVNVTSQDVTHDGGYVKDTGHKENKTIKLDKARQQENIDEITSEALNILSYYENITGIVGVFSIASLKVAISEHGSKYLTMAIKKALGVNKPNMEYVNGILRNWRIEGYPKSDRGYDNSVSGSEINTFKPQPPKILSKEQMEQIVHTLI